HHPSAHRVFVGGSLFFFFRPILTALIVALPKAEGLLPKRRLIVAKSTAVFNTYQNFVTLKLHTYSKPFLCLAGYLTYNTVLQLLHSEPERSWTDRCRCSYNTHNQTFVVPPSCSPYDMTLFAYLIAVDTPHPSCSSSVLAKSMSQCSARYSYQVGFAHI
ncbi:hypothetical protein PAXRUDRAFT_393290, partial [Paxillus rubicundulus Ve08.2h10]